MTDTPEPPEDVIKNANALSEKLRKTAMEDTAKFIAEGLKDTFGGEEALANAVTEMDRAVKALLTPELAAEMETLNKAFNELQTTGKASLDEPTLIERFTALQNNPEYTAALETVMKQLFEAHFDPESPVSLTPGGMD